MLESEGCRATFFLVGMMVERNPGLVKLIQKKGMEIGNHSYDDSRLKYLAEEKKKESIVRTSGLIEGITGEPVLFFRPPGGRYDWGTIALAEEEGLEVILWDVNSNDSGGRLTQTALLNNVLAHAENLSIVLLHSGRNATLEVLPMLLRTLKSRGFSMVTVSELKERGKKCYLSEKRQRSLF